MGPAQALQGAKLTAAEHGVPGAQRGDSHPSPNATLQSSPCPLGPVQGWAETATPVPATWALAAQPQRLALLRTDPTGTLTCVRTSGIGRVPRCHRVVQKAPPGPSLRGLESLVPQLGGWAQRGDRVALVMSPGCLLPWGTVRAEAPRPHVSREPGWGDVMSSSHSCRDLCLLSGRHSCTSINRT